MSVIYYAAVEDDPLTSGNGSRVFAMKQGATIQGEDGKRRSLAFIGDDAYCPACNTTGVITYGAGVGDRRRLLDRVNNRRQAVGGDIVLCKCAQHPRIIALYGRKWRITDRDNEARASFAKGPLQSLVYDEQFTLTDASGKALLNTYYTVRLPSGELQHGLTDSSGRTTRYITDAAQHLRIYLGHRE
ncbi:hypothetical protein SAMN05443245_6857 [Paraburkholderia fungorum]|uniref:PAAR domain-containing protein n=1 Tax=Paraburkholderia fungorum TaxID=134537 RepID=A0A1H1JMM4_9BURK|nr:hypothetical protein [Paraburkholderia fungorum]SDR51192.1 hypothetical protein SAMN05443245_6857 [Paraburkholderia fungorum]